MLFTVCRDMNVGIASLIYQQIYIAHDLDQGLYPIEVHKVTLKGTSAYNKLTLQLDCLK